MHARSTTREPAGPGQAAPHPERGRELDESSSIAAVVSQAFIWSIPENPSVVTGRRAGS